jgi:hypothetical protein
MKWKLLFCAAVLAAAGCASDSHDYFTDYENFGFRADLIPAPVEGLTSADSDAANAAVVISRSTTPGQNN